MEKYNFRLASLTDQFPSLQTLQFYISRKLNSKVKDHRSLLRKELLTYLPEMPRPAWLERLEVLPQTDQFNISISHSTELSGFAWVQKPHHIGIDIENRERITEPLIARVSSSEEVSSHSNPSYIWPAKEAAWKALNQLLNLEILSQIETHHWKNINDHTMTFKVSANEQKIDGLGLCVLEENTFLSFYILDSTFIENYRQK